MKGTNAPGWGIFDIFTEQQALQEEAQLAASAAKMPSRTLIWVIPVHNLDELARQKCRHRSPSMLKAGSRQFRLEIYYKADAESTETSEGEKPYISWLAVCAAPQLKIFMFEQANGAFSFPHMERRSGPVMTASS